ncbi:hypothetical protein EWM64_g5226 [Hericium alpestre]|uniref:Peptidase M3A/M3B catalytic domain-containing protein n=1 Tax=Hericium alpestre TaxID=135208 RepID=A0A4Y9ZZC5_9AGAM|nr:hypothetical protein EWM64_g5226 [Hericium alpestre]
MRPFLKSCCGCPSSPRSVFSATSQLSSLRFASKLPGMPALAPPQNAPTWTHSEKDIIQLTKDAIERDRQLQDKVAGLSAKQCTFESVFLALAYGKASLDAVTAPLGFYKDVYPSKELRDASIEAEVLVRDFGVESSMRLDVYQAKVAAEKNIEASDVELNPEEGRLVHKMLTDGRCAGLALPEKEREELKELKKELSQGVVIFTPEELKGVPEDVLSGYTRRLDEKGMEVYVVTHQAHEIFPLWKYPENPETRRRAYEDYEGRLAINMPLLDRALELRRRINALLGYNIWADFRTEEQMAKSEIAPPWCQRHEVLLGMKQKEHEEKGLPFDGEFYIWDNSYYDRKFLEESLSLDGDLVKEYFPVSVVVPTVLEIYQNFLGVRFEEVKDGSTWHPDVQMFTVWENDAKDATGFVGYCYLDLFARESKYPSAAVWPLLPSYQTPDGKQAYPLSVLVASLGESTPERPAFMRHFDVVTLFHEMGHIFQSLLSRTQFPRFHGTSAADDFVEAPSQMLENWCWEPKVLAKISSHYKTGLPLSTDLIDKLVKCRYVNVGLFYLRQVFLAKFDLKAHTDKDAQDYTAFWNDLRESIALVKTGRQGPGQAAFGHIVGGYDVGYYGFVVKY